MAVQIGQLCKGGRLLHICRDIARRVPGQLFLLPQEAADRRARQDQGDGGVNAPAPYVPQRQHHRDQGPGQADPGQPPRHRPGQQIIADRQVQTAEPRRRDRRHDQNPRRSRKSSQPGQDGGNGFSGRHLDLWGQAEGSVSGRR